MSTASSMPSIEITGFAAEVRYRWTGLAAGTVAQACFSAITVGLAVLAPTLREEYGLSLGEVGVVLSAAWLGATVTLLPWGARRRPVRRARRPRPRPARVGAVSRRRREDHELRGLAGAARALRRGGRERERWSDVLWLLVPAVALAGGLSMAWNGLSFTVAAELAGATRSGAAIGFQQSVLSGLGVLAPVLFAATVSSASWSAAFLFAALLTMVGWWALRPLRGY